MLTLPAPTGGWNAINPLTNMAPTDAIIMENLIPNSTDVTSRNGYAEHVNVARPNAKRLIPYNGSDDRLLLCADGNIFDITDGGTGVDLTGDRADFGSDEWIFGAYKNRIVMCNGVDAPLQYDGTAISDITVTGPVPEQLRGGVTYRGRVYYWERPDGDNPQSFWYANAGAFQGELEEYPLDEFTRGGYIVQLLNWTFDGGAGLDDHLAVFMSTGEVIIYSGGDPGSIKDWAMVGVYQIGEPVGEIPASQVGGDILALTQDGYLILSAAIREGRYSENSAFSLKINPAAQDAARRYGQRYGWHSTLFSDASLFIVNVPITSSQSVQHVRNTSTGAWCKFTGINALSFAVSDGTLFFAATDGKVYRYGGKSDNGSFIPLRATQAYNYFGSPGNKKQVTTVEVQSNFAYPKYLYSDFWADFSEETLPPTLEPPEPIPSEWDVGAWDASSWDQSSDRTIVERRNVEGFGYALAHTLRLSTRAQEFKWFASHLYLTPGGIT